MTAEPPLHRLLLSNLDAQERPRTIPGFKYVVKAADERNMAKPRKEQSGEEQELKPQMRELILTFDAKDRRDEEAARKFGKESKERRRRSDKSARTT